MTFAGHNGPKGREGGSRLIVLVFSGPIDRRYVGRLCRHVSGLLERSDADLVICDVGGLVDPDAGTVEALCRLQLTARRLGRRVELLDVRGELRDLLAMTGLSGVVPPCADLSLEPGGEAEQRKQPRGIEEERDPADPVA
jgi:ABC-type transporter Mla MlaB component